MAKITIADKVAGDSHSATEFNQVKASVNALYAEQEAHNSVLTFDKNKYMDTSVSQSGAIAYSLAASGNVDGMVIRHKILSDGVNPITFTADFNVFGKSANDLYPAGLHIFYFNYVGGEVDVSIPTYDGEVVAADTTAPTISSATIQNATPTNLIVVFSEVVNITDLTGLSITGTSAPTITSFSGSGTNTLTFVLSAAATGGQALTLNVAAGNTIKDVATNTLAATTQAITNNVAVPNSAPSATADSFSVNQNGTLNGNVLTNDTDPDGDALTAILVSNVTNGTLTLNANGSFTYTPNTDYTGSDSFTYKVNDGTVDGNTVTVSITVNAATATMTLQSSYPMTETTGNMIDTVNGVNGTVGTAVTRNGVNYDFPGVDGGGFTNTQAVVTIPDSVRNTFTDGQGNDIGFEMEFQYTPDVVGDGMLLNKRSTNDITTGNAEYQMLMYQGALSFALIDAAGNQIKKGGYDTSALTAGTEYTFKIIYDASKTAEGITLMVNGVSVGTPSTSGTGTYSGMPNSASPLVLGKSGWTESLGIDGKLRNLKISKVV